MKINKQTAIKLWKERYGNKLEVCDFAGRPMFFLDYNNRDSNHGWNIDHILAQDRNGKDNVDNLIICNIKTNDEKANRTTFVANNKRFQVKLINGKYEICEHIDNPDYYDDPKIWYDFFKEEVEYDFANREIRYEDFRNDRSKYGWDVCIINSQVGPINGNLTIANIKTIYEKNNRNSFIANGYKFQIYKNEFNEYTLYSPDVIADKLNVNAVLKYINADDNYINIIYTIIDLRNLKKQKKIRFDEVVLKIAKLIQGLSDDLKQFIRFEINDDNIVVYFELKNKADVREIMEFNIFINAYKKIFEDSFNTTIDVASDLINIPENKKYFPFNCLRKSIDKIDCLIECINTQLDSSLYIGEEIKNNLNYKQFKLYNYKTFVGQLGICYNVFECKYILKLSH